MIKYILLLLLANFTIVNYAQTLTIKGKVLDVDGDAVPDVRYFFANSPSVLKKTDREGNYEIEYTVGENDSLKFQHFGFGDFTFYVTSRMEKRAKKSGIINYDVTLPDRMLNVFVVRPNVPDTLFGTQEYSVADFEFDKSGDIILLTYEKNLSKGSVLRVLNKNKEITDQYYVQGEAIELRSDYKGNTHLITEERIFLVNVRAGKLYVYLEDRDYFFKYVTPLIDTIGSRIYFSNYSAVYPSFEYFEFNRADSAYTELLTVEDSPMMELYRSEFKYVDVRTKIWAHNKQLETGVDKEIWVGATVFTNSIYYEPLYAPLFKVGSDSIFMFDHYKNQLFKYSPESGVADSVRISYHKEARKSGWEQPLLQDRVNDKIYGVFLRNGYTYLSEIDCNTGLIKKSFRLHFKYVEHIKIIDGYVYYVYRPYESVQKKYIYKEPLFGSD